MKDTLHVHQRSDHQSTMLTPESSGNAFPQEINHANVSIRNLSIVATSKAVQQSNGSYDVVVTSEGKGTFLIRRRKNQETDGCAFFAYEVRRIQH